MYRGYYPGAGHQRYASNVEQALVLDKVSTGLIMAAVISTVMTFVPLALLLLVGVVAFVAEIIASIGYFFARKETTLEKLYYTFVTSSAVLLGISFVFMLADPNGLIIIGSAAGVTALIVTYLYRRVAQTQPDVMRHANRMFTIGLIFIALNIFMIFAFNLFFYFIMSIFGALLFSWYLWFDFGRLMRGEFTSPTRMAWSIYWDILLLFRYILNILYILGRDR